MYTRTCAVCAVTFTAVRATAATCSGACRVRRHRLRKRAAAERQAAREHAAHSERALMFEALAALTAADRLDLAEVASLIGRGKSSADE